MGLDMYLYRREYLSNYSWGANHEKERNAFQSIVEAIGIEPTEQAPHIHVEVCVAYWRKANAIHKWFCNLDDGRDECQRIYVTMDNLLELRTACQLVVDGDVEPERFLPTQAGFFFGSTDYDEWYENDLKLTIKQIDRATKPIKSDYADFFYQASW